MALGVSRTRKQELSVETLMLIKPRTQEVSTAGLQRRSELTSWQPNKGHVDDDNGSYLSRTSLHILYL